MNAKMEDFGCKAFILLYFSNSCFLDILGNMNQNFQIHLTINNSIILGFIQSAPNGEWAEGTFKATTTDANVLFRSIIYKAVRYIISVFICAA